MLRTPLELDVRDSDMGGLRHDKLGTATVTEPEHLPSDPSPPVSRRCIVGWRNGRHRDSRPLAAAGVNRRGVVSAV